MPDHPLFYRLNDLSTQPQPRLALAIGIFDGVHRGHQALLADAVALAPPGSGIEPAALTFDPHPAAIFAPTTVPLLLGTLPERCALLRQSGAQRVVVARFDRAFADLTPERFVNEVLVERLGVAAVVVGEDFHYGRDRAGDIAALLRAGEQHGFTVHVLGPVAVDGRPARSTVIRRLLGEGDAETAARLLGRPYTLSGSVVRGRQLGRTIGFPTANLESAPGILIPANGVYAGRVRVGDEQFRAAISVGDNPTVAPPGVQLPRTVEAYLLDGFARDLYGARIQVAFVSRLRGMEKYDGLDALVTQMHRDVAETERRLSPDRPGETSAAG